MLIELANANGNPQTTRKNGHRGLHLTSLLRAALLATSGLCSLVSPIRAQDAQWLTTPGSNDFNNAANWSSGVVPSGTAVFFDSNTTDITFQSPTTDLGGMLFNDPDTDYSFTISSLLIGPVGRLLNIRGNGIVTNNANISIFNQSGLNFLGTSTAGGANIINSGTLHFNDSSNAGTANITTTLTRTRPDIKFFENTSAANSTIALGDFASLMFFDNSTAANARLEGQNGFFISFELTSGASGDNRVSAGSIAGNAPIFLGFNQLTVGGNDASTLVSGQIADVVAGEPTKNGSIRKIGSGTLTLTGENTYTAGTIVDAGTLQIGDGGTTGSVAGNIVTNASLVYNYRSNRSANNAISGVGSLTKLGQGTLTLTAQNTHSGGTTVSEGTLRIGDGGTTGSISGNIINNGSVIFNRADDNAFGGAISGTGSVTKSGAGTLTFSGANTYSGFTLVSDGALRSATSEVLPDETSLRLLNDATFDLDGNQETIRALRGDGNVLLGSGSLTIDGAEDSTLSGVISGTGSIVKRGTSTLSLAGANTHTGGTDISGGTLQVDGSIIGTGIVNAGGTLAGSGSAQNILVANGGRIAPGSGTVGTLNIGSLRLNNSSILDFELGLPGSIGGSNNDLIEVSGDLVLDGLLNVTDIGGFGAGIYRLINYGGTLTDNELAIGFTPPGIPAADLLIQTSVNNQVNLISTAGAELGFWDGGNPALYDNGVVDGGMGTWRADGRAWTTIDGAFNGSYNPNPTFAVFGGTAGTVTVDDVAGAIAVDGIQFATDGYLITGDSIALSNANTTIRVGDGTIAGNAMTATIASVLTGTAALNKVDLGTLVLSGNNTYTGGTTISAGTLRLGAQERLADSGAVNTLAGSTFDLNGFNETVASLSGAGNVTFGAGNFTAGDVNNTLFSGIMSGTGSFTKTGSGVFVLTGENTYSGGTTITSGALQIGNGGTSGSINGSINNNAELIFNRSDNITYGGSITGSGELTKVGDGTLTLTGTNTHTGGTTISTGALQIGSGGTIGSIAGNVLNNSRLTFNRSDDLAYNGDITGSGSLTKAGAGVLTLTGSNVHLGGTTIATGILQIGDGGTEGSIVGNVLTNARFVFNRSDDVTFAGNTSGTGNLTKLGDGTLTLTGTNTHTGGTTVSFGTLQIGDGGTTGSVTGDIETNAVLVFNRSDSIEFDDTISGAGTLIKRGAGALTLTAANTFTSGININEGSLFNNGSLASEVFVNNGLYGGTGSSSSLEVAGGSTVAPGDNGIGTLTVNGDARFRQGATFQVDISPDGMNDILAVTGVTTIADTATTLDIVGAPGDYPITRDYRILTSGGGVTGEFAEVRDNLPDIDMSAVYNANDIELTYFQTDLLVSAKQIHPVATTAARDANLAFARTLRRRGGLSSLNEGSANTASNRSFGFTSKDQTSSTRTSSSQPTTSGADGSGAGSHIQTEPAPDWGIWGAAIGSISDVDASGSTPGSDTNLGGFAAGFEGRFDSSGVPVTAGLAAGYTVSNIDSGSSDASIDSWHVGAYSAATTGGLTVSAALSAAFQDYEFNRPVTFNGGTVIAHGETDGYALTGSVEAFYDVMYPGGDAQFNGLRFGPLATLDIAHVRQDGFTETGAGILNLSVSTTKATQATTGLGVGFGFDRDVDGKKLTLDGRVAWEHAFGDTSISTTSVIPAANATFISNAAPQSRNRLAVGLGAALKISETLSTHIRYDGHLSSTTSEHGGSAGLTFRF